MDYNPDRRQVVALVRTGAVALAFWGVLPRQARSSPGRVSLSESEWRRRLGPERFRILRQSGTERPYSSALDKEYRRGTFRCAGCALPLFSSAAKFNSRTGWPSFFRPLPNAVLTRSDHMHGMSRTEVICRRCRGHLGHVFKDGPRPTGLRYCINGLALRFVPV